MDFEGSDNIIIRENSNLWGPFEFDFSNALPSGHVISAVTVKSYSRTYKPQDSAEDFTEIDLIDPEYTPEATDDTEVTVKLQYPGDDYKGKATLVFNVTLVSGGTHEFFFHRVKVV